MHQHDPLIKEIEIRPIGLKKSTIFVFPFPAFLVVFSILKAVLVSVGHADALEYKEDYATISN